MRVFLYGILFVSWVFAKDAQLYESQPNIPFKYKTLYEKEQSISLERDFNSAVLYMNQEEYLRAITLFKQTAKILKIPSFLNIGICYYKLGSQNNAYLYLKKIYDLKAVAKEDIFSYMSAAFYLYFLTNDRKYLTTITDIAKELSTKRFTEDVKRLVSDTYIIIKDYDMAIKIIKTMNYQDDLKLALLYLKIKNYDMASIHLNSAYENFGDKEKINEILWFKIFRDLKANSLVTLQDNIVLLQENLMGYETNRKLPLKIFFNPNKYSAKEYLLKITNFEEKRKIDMIFYFAPFIFVDRKEIYNDSVLGYVLENQENIELIDNMIQYNKELLKVIKKDPIERTVALQSYVDQPREKKSYEYYNLALSYAQIYDFDNAFKYFKKAYDLSHANKLFSAMTLLAAQRTSIKLDKNFEAKIKANLVSKGGNYEYLGKYVYKIIFDPKLLLPKEKPSRTDRKSIFLRALDFIDNTTEKGLPKDAPLLAADVKDPLVFLFRLLARDSYESDYEYISRLQDNIPKQFNDYFVKGSQVIINYYLDSLRALGVYNRVDFEIKGEDSPSYLRAQAIIKLYDGKPLQSIKILENLQKKYNLNDRYTNFILAAAYLSINDNSNAFATIGMLQFEKNDNNARFLSGIQLMQNLKLNSVLQYFNTKYDGEMIDFKIDGFDEYLESL